MQAIGPKNPVSAGLRAALGLSKDDVSMNTVGGDIGNHIWAFVDTEESAKKGELIVTARSTGEMLEALGFKTRAGGHILTKPFALRQKHLGNVEVDRIREGIRAQGEGINADTGAFDPVTGNINADRAAAFWSTISKGKGYVTKEDVEDYVNGPKIAELGPLQLKKPGKVLNELEIRLLFDMAAQVTDKGERVLAADRYVAFLDGTIWQDFAKARATETAYEPRPVGALVHEGAKKVASKLAALAAAAGGVAADPGTSAIWQANITIDTEASLREQQRTKTLLPTIAGAMKALCPLGFG